MTASTRKDCIAFALIMVVVFMFKSNVLPIGYFWDEIYAYVGPAYKLSEGSLWSVLPGLHPDEMFMGHPPFLFLILAVCYSVFGANPVVSHAVTQFFAAICVFGTYKLTSSLSGFWEGVCAAALLLFSPIFFAQAGICTADIFVAALCVWTVYFYLKGEMLPYLVIGICLALTKLTAIGVFVPIICYDFIVNIRNGLNVRRVMLLSVPVLIAGAFLLSQYITTGRFVPNSYFDTNDFFSKFDSMALLEKAFGIFLFLFVEQLRIILSAAICLFVVINRKRIDRKLYLFMGIFLFFIISFSAMFYLSRYITLLLPLYFSLAAVAAFNVVKRQMLTVIALGIIAASSLYLSYNPEKNDGRYDVSMKYYDFVRLHQEAAKFLENNFTDIVLLSDSPFEIAVKDPRNGYVSRPIESTMEIGPRVNTAVLFSKPNKQKLTRDGLKEDGFLPVKTLSIGSLQFEIFRKPD